MSEQDPYWGKAAPPEYDDMFPARGYEPIQPQRRGPREILSRIWAPIAAVGAFLLKFGAVIFKLKAFGLIASVGVYVWIGGWLFGVGLVVLLFVHEMGHWLEAKRQGLDVSWPAFIPFLGAVITMRQMPPNAWREAEVALAGPLLGTAGALVTWAIGSAIDSRAVVALAFVGFFINLFNLLPVVPLDGGRAVSALHPGLWLVGLVGLGALAFFRPNFILILILIFAAMELWRRWKTRGEAMIAGYYQVTAWQRAAVAVVYFGLAAFLVFAMNATHVPRDF
jgi:Zn-dependent protease